MKKNQKGQILNNEKISIDTCKMIIKSDVKKIEAGQFISILCKNKTLRRPFSVCDFEAGKITLMYKVKGGGTGELSNLKAGDTVDFLAPLGNAFDFNQKKSALLAGAGIGIAPMLFLKKTLDEANIKNFLITGFKSGDEIIKGSDKTVIGGSVVDYVEDLIKELHPDVIYSCGPSIVLKLLSEIGKKHGIEVQIAMEKVMACGIGVCRGCVIKTIQNGEIKNKTVCKDGPVFKGDEVVW